MSFSTFNPRYRVDARLGTGEICTYGHRNIFRCGFDREDDTLYCGEVGHNKVEEINIIE